MGFSLLSWGVVTLSPISILLSALLITLLVFIPGAVWSQLKREQRPVLRETGLTIFVGLLIAVGAGFILALFGVFSLLSHSCSILLLSFFGAVNGYARFGRSYLLRMRGLVVPAALVSVVIGCVLLVPGRGEWIVGGWDPGVYLNGGIALEQEGGFSQEARPVYDQLAGQGRLHLFTRQPQRVVEAFPGVPVELQSGRIGTYFFPLTTTAVAVLHAYGGYTAATRASGILSVFALMMFIWMMLECGMPRSWVWASGLLLLFQPIFLYHAHTPSSEMLEFVLLAGVVACLFRRESSRVWVWMAGAGLALGTLNRISFVLFGFLLVACLSVAELLNPKRRKVFTDHIVLSALLTAGLMVDLLLFRDATANLHHVLPRIYMALAVLFTGTMIVDVIGCRAKVGRMLHQAIRAFGPMLAVAALLSLLPLREFSEFRSNMDSLLPFWGITIFALAAVGVLFCYFFPGRVSVGNDTRMVITFLLLSAFIVLKQKHTADLYPWATKRFLVNVVPALALLGGFGAMNIAGFVGRSGRMRPIVASSVVLAALAPTMPRAANAWRHTEYNGCGRILAQIARQLPDGDVVVADHFWWGTPLYFIHGKQVLNGQRIWKEDDPVRCAEMEAALQDLQKAGHVIWFLTSTSEGMEVFPSEFRDAEEVWTSDPLEYDEVVHHRDASDFKVREKEKVFRIFRWL